MTLKLPIRQYLNIALMILFISVLLTWCRKNEISPFGFSPVNDLTTKIKSSVRGFVTDENNLAVYLATVQVGAVTITTDKYGYFEATNVDVVKNAAVVTVTRAGYFKGIKTYIAAEGKSAFFRIKLIPRTNSGNINAGTGGAITLINGLSITFPANAIVNATSNAAYTGRANVAAYWIDPTSPDLNNTMPGDLMGLNISGNLQLLTTYGMAAIELTGSSGELLQIAPGKKAILSLPIPASLSPSAPATIPLWYFDEAKGLWKQEGTATKTGNNYVGEVTHFSFWNCDVPNSYVQFNCTVVNSGGQPIQNAVVKISVVSNPVNFRYGYTDGSGYVNGAIPNNAQLLLEVFTNSCTTAFYSQIFTTTNSNVSLGTISINNTAFPATVTGTVTNCNNTPVTNGYIMVQTGNNYVRHPLSNTGSFNFTILLCNSTTNVNLIAVDASTLQHSSPINQTLVVGTNTVGNLQACGIQAQEFLYYSIDGTNYLFASPYDSIGFSGATNSPEAYVYALQAGLQFSNSGIGVNTTQSLWSFHAPQLPSSQQIPPNWIGVLITEYGPVGQFIAGNFSGTLREQLPPNTIHNVSCSFRVRRWQ